MNSIVVIELVQLLEQLSVRSGAREFDMLRGDSHFRRVLQLHSNVNVRVFAVANLGGKKGVEMESKQQ